MLRENLLTLFACINNREPLVIIGKPGSGKTLSINCIGNSMKGEFSENVFLQTRLGLLIYRYQGSKNTTSKDIQRAFKTVRSTIVLFKKNKEIINNIPIFLFDEMGLVQRRDDMVTNPLKVLHSELEFENNTDKNNKISFVGISNWRLDSAKMNRTLYLLISDPDENDLIETAKSIGNVMDKDIVIKYGKFLEILSVTYYEYKKIDLNLELKKYISMNNNQIGVYYYLNDFHGNRDFYFFIRNSMNDLIEEQKNISKDNKDLILAKIGIKNISKNFGGLPEVINIIKNIFIKNFTKIFPNLDLNDIPSYNPILLIEENLCKSFNNSRYLMLLNNFGSNDFLIKSILKNIGIDKFDILKGSPLFNDLTDEEGILYKKTFMKNFEELSRKNNIIIMKNLENIYPSLFNLFDKNFIKLKDKNTYSNPDLFFEINPEMKIIILTSHNQLRKENLPFINRFEKHIISMDNLLKKEYIDISKEIWNQLELITSYNNNKKLNIDLKDMLIIKNYEEIQGLVYKIITKNDLEKNKNINLKKYIEEEIYKILVPTFSQDLIISIKYSGFEKKHKELCDYIYKIYKDKSNFNFENFFHKINFENNIKYIIYTFSDIFGLSNIIKKNGYNAQEQLIDEVRSERQIDKLLNIFYNNNIDNKNTKNKNNFLIFHFREIDLYKIEYISYKINQYEIKNSSSNINLVMNKIIFVIHLKRKKLLEKKNYDINEENIPLYHFHNLLNIDDNGSNNNNGINSCYEHLFIDNLLSTDDYFINIILSEYNNKNNNIDIFKNMLNINSFFDKYLYQTFSYFSYDYYNENDKINKKNYTKKIIIELTKYNQENININIIAFLKQRIFDVMLKQSSFNIKKIIPKIYISNLFHKDDIDFFEVLKTYIFSSLKKTFLLIIYILEKNNILYPIILNQNSEEKKIIIYKDIINQFFDSLDISIYNQPKEEYNANKIKLILGLNIPGSAFMFKEFKKKYLLEQNIIKRYQDNENLLRIINNKKENNKDNEEKNNYLFEYNKLIGNTEEEIKKNYYFYNIIILKNNNEIKKELIYDYMKIYISELSKKFNEGNKNIKFDYNSIIHYIEIILSIKFISEIDNIFFTEKVSLYESNQYIKIMSSIILFLEGFSYEILSLIEIYILISNYIKDYSKKILEQIKSKEDTLNNNENIIFNDLFIIIIDVLTGTVFQNYDEINNLTIFDFYQIFEKMKYIHTIILKIMKKQQIASNNDMIYSLEILLMIYEIATKKNDNSELFKKFLINVLQNLNESIKYIKNKNNDKLIQNIVSLDKIIKNKFTKNSKEYCFTMNKIYFIVYTQTTDDDIKYSMIKLSFENNKLNYNSIYFLNHIFDIKYNINSKDIFEFFEKEKNNKYIIFFENIKSELFNQIILYHFELLLNQSFSQIYHEKKIFNNTHLAQALNYLNEPKINFSNIKKIFCIALIKVFIHYFSKIYMNDKNKDKILDIKNFELLIKSDEEISSLKYVIKIYFFKCIYFNNFDNINKLTIYITSDNNFPFRDDYMEYHKEIKKENFIFENCFIPINYIDIYLQEKSKIKEMHQNMFKNINILNYDFYIKDNLDSFYCLFINHIFSQIFDIDDKKKEESNIIFNNFITELESNILNKNLLTQNKEYLLIFKNLYTKKIINKISQEQKQSLTLNQLEILFYSIRFVLSSNDSSNPADEKNNNIDNYYSLLLKPNSSEIISNSYVPGTTPFNNVYLNSYYALKELMPITNENEYGFYICSCGQYYTLGKCTCPAYQFNCQNCGLIIGGIGHYLEEREDHFRLYLNKEKFNENVFARDEVISNKIPYMFFDEYKKKYIDKYLNKEPKGITKEDISVFIERKNMNIRKMGELTFRVLNFILYSHLLCANAINNLSDDILNNKFTHGDYSCFKCIEKDWEIINDILREKNINNIKSFMNIIFNDITTLLKKCEMMDTVEKRRNFEQKVNEYINGLINDKDNLNYKMEEYKKLNEKIKNSDPGFIDEIILENYPPIEQYYHEKKYPELRYFMKSIYPDIDLLYDELRLIQNYQQKYPLINQVIINPPEFRFLSNVSNINKLSNLLIKKYSYKISREDSKKISIVKSINNDINNFENEYLNPFIDSWNKIKQYCTRYLCRPDMPILNMDKNTELNYFLVDDGELGGGMYLASAYSNFIEWQNKFISLILDNINQDSVLYCYLEQLNEEIYVQDAKDENILNMDDNVQNKLKDMIMIYSIRNIFDNDKINYSNYRRIKFNFDEIESELGRLILPGLKKFKSIDDPITFITYLYEGHRSQKSEILLKYEIKYPSRNLTKKEQNILYNFIHKFEKNRKIMNDFLSSSEILINYIQKENYNKSIPLYQIIQELPDYIYLNTDLIKLFENNNQDKSLFTISTLLNIFKLFEFFCWKEIKMNINEQYKEKIEKKKKIEIIEFFKEYNINNNRIITKKDLAFALRRLISRYLGGKRGDTDIDEKQKLIGQIIRNDLWELYIIQNEEKFQNEIYSLTFDLKVSQAYDYYEILEGDSYEIFDLKEIENENKINSNNDESYIINKIIEDEEGE